MNLSFVNLFFVNKNMFPDTNQVSHEEHHKQVSWVYFAIMVLGLWLITSPIIFGYSWTQMFWNDIISGIILIILSYNALNAYNLWAQWLIILLGLWLFVAPIVFWANEAAAFLNDNLIATLVVAFGIIIPNQPGIKLFEQEGKNTPPGWSYNPSSWIERTPIITMAWFGYFAAQYLAAFQLGFIDKAWDPFFEDGTKNVLTSEVSKAFPVSDAALGAFAYILDVLMGYAGGTNRWRTMPWAVIIFGILILPLGVISITLVILQPLAVGYWCSLCLFTALISTIMIPFTIDEMLATIQLMRHESKRGKALWTIFWFGGSMEGGYNEKTPEPALLLKKTGKVIMMDFFTKPWNLFISAAVGLAIMTAPAYIEYTKKIANNNYVIGALIITFSVIATSEVARPVRFLNMFLGLWMIASPWILGSAQTEAILASVTTGAVLIPLSIPKGKVKDRRGDYDNHIF